MTEMTGHNSEPHDNANVVVLPPIIFFVPLFASIIARYFIPLPLPLGNSISMGLAMLLLILGASLMAWAFLTFKEFREDPDPRVSTQVVVSNGPFKYTRNPMYIAFFLIYIGLTFALNSLWPFIFIPFIFWFLYKGVVLREEMYMEGKFGDQYRMYKKAVGRWL